jgi:hypothetical protein
MPDFTSHLEVDDDEAATPETFWSSEEE